MGQKSVKSSVFSLLSRHYLIVILGNRFVIWSDSVICSYAMQGIEEEAMRRNGINAITKVISGVTDDMLSAMNSMGIIRRRECAKKRCIHMRLG